MPVRFVSRVLKDNELRYHPVEKEVLALLRTLEVCQRMLSGRRLKVVTRASTLAWLLRTKGLQGRLSQWAALLSPWTFEIAKATGGEDDVLGVLTASITPREKIDEALTAIKPQKAGRQRAPMSLPIPTFTRGDHVFVAIFDGSAKPKRAGGSCGAVLWAVPEWTVVAAALRFFADATVNEAEYRGMELALELAHANGARGLIVCGDSNLVVRQLLGEMDCKSPGLQSFHASVSKHLGTMNKCQLLHVKRDFNAALDRKTRTPTRGGRGGHSTS